MATNNRRRMTISRVTIDQGTKKLYEYLKDVPKRYRAEKLRFLADFCLEALDRGGMPDPFAKAAAAPPLAAVPVAVPAAGRRRDGRGMAAHLLKKSG